MGQLGH